MRRVFPAVLTAIVLVTSPAFGFAQGKVTKDPNAATRAAQNNQPADARRMARWVFYQDVATGKQKADMGELIATTYENEPDQALTWLRNALPFATGAQRTRVQNMITALGGQP